MLTAVNVALFFAVAFGISESLAQIPQVKANSVFQAIKNILGMLSGKSNS
jgi:hypothetical protein